VTGRTLSHYEILDDLGAGGMGVVYRAHDTRLDRDVAIKVLPTDRPLSETARKRFQREALAASALNHPNIITIYEVGSEGDTDFIVMEYVRGATLSSLLKKRPLGLAEATRYCVQIAEALAKAHGSGIIHRDLKPGNIMITEDGLVKVLDFGLAKFDVSAATKDGEIADNDTAAKEFTLTQPGMITGTVAYMSPEQARGERVDARSDIFSFGIVMFETLSRHLPFPGPNSIALLHNLHFSPPRDLGELAPKVPKPLASLISKMLEKKPEKRIQTMSEVATELRKHAAGLVDGPVTWHPSDATVEMGAVAAAGTKKICWRNVWLAGAAVVLVILGGMMGWRHFRKVKLAQTASAPIYQPGDTAYTLYQRARQNLDHWDREGNIDNAIKLGERAVQLDPQSAASYAVLGEAYVIKNRTNNPDPQWMKLASQYANKAVELDSYLSAAHISLGLAKMESGDTADAEKELKAAADLDPKNEAPHRWLAMVFDKTGRSDDAKRELARAIELDRNQWEIYMELGLNAYQVGNYTEAVSHWEEALRMEPDNVPALRNLGGGYHVLGRDEDAAGALQHALQIKADADVYNNLGTIRFYQGRYQDAVPAFEKTVALGANSFDNWANLADAYRWTPGNADKAKQAYDTAIRLVREEIAKNPNQADLRADLALYLSKNGDKSGALTELKAVEQAYSKDPSVLYSVAVAYELCGGREKALDGLLAAVKAGQSLDEIKNDPELVSLRADPRYHLKIEGGKPKP
jgi:tetratricopeptide (TPR) repeat protein/predicted Ser/Thr protein kinase